MYTLEYDQTNALQQWHLQQILIHYVLTHIFIGQIWKTYLLE